MIIYYLTWGVRFFRISQVQSVWLFEGHNGFMVSCKALFEGLLRCSPDQDVDLPRFPQDPLPPVSLLAFTPIPGGGPQDLFPDAPQISDAKLAVL